MDGALGGRRNNYAACCRVIFSRKPSTSRDRILRASRIKGSDMSIYLSHRWDTMRIVSDIVVVFSSAHTRTTLLARYSYLGGLLSINQICQQFAGARLMSSALSTISSDYILVTPALNITRTARRFCF
eukprot:scaffold251203_cov19-Prasinocladus_malaysianus.AAC.2